MNVYSGVPGNLQLASCQACMSLKLKERKNSTKHNWLKKRYSRVSRFAECPLENKLLMKKFLLHKRRCYDINNSLYLARKYARSFVREHYNSEKRTVFRLENSELQGTDTV